MLIIFGAGAGIGALLWLYMNSGKRAVRREMREHAKRERYRREIAEENQRKAAKAHERDRFKSQIRGMFSE